MKERPILFNGEMVRAMLNGTKTQTRRVMKPQLEIVADPLDAAMGGQSLSIRIRKRVGVSRVMGWRNYAEEFSPYGKPGDQLWVREAWTRDGNVDTYRASNDWISEFKKEEPESYKKLKKMGVHPRWKPSIFMPRIASRIDLLIKDVRVERVQDVLVNDDIDDILAEGVKPVFREVGDKHPDFSYTAMAFEDLWNSINDKRGFGWDVNPWTWVVEFERIRP